MDCYDTIRRTIRWSDIYELVFAVSMDFFGASHSSYFV